MKDELDMIFSDKDSDIEKISSRYKAVDDQRKEKIYEISKRKYNILKAGESEAADDGFIVSAEGVERYSRPKLYRYFSAAAAALVLFGGAFGGVMLSRSSKVQHMSSSSNTGVTEATSEGVTKADIFSDDTVVDKLLSKETGMPVLVSEDALSCVGEGTGKSLENIELLKRVVMTSKKLNS